MDIIFQSGDFFNESNSWFEFLSQFISECAGAFIGAGSAILLFYLQNKKDKDVMESNRQNKAEDDINYLSSLLENVIEDQEKQNLNIEIYIKNMSSNLSAQIEAMNSIPLKNLNRLCKLLDEPETYNSFMLIFGRNNLENINNYKRILASIDYLIDGNKQLTGILEMASPNDYNRRMAYNETSTKIIHAIKSEALAYDPQPKELLALLDQYMTKDKPKTILEHIDVIVNPLLQIIDNLHKNYSSIINLKDGLLTLLRYKEEIEYQNKVIVDKLDSGFEDIKNTIMNLKSEGRFLIEYYRKAMKK